MGYYERMREHSLVKKYIYLFILKNPLEFDLLDHAKNSTDENSELEVSTI